MTTKPPSSYIFKICIIFFLSFATGYLVAAQKPAVAHQFAGQLGLAFSFLKGISAFHLFIYLFLHNAIIALLVILLGFFFGIVPIFTTFINGIVIGIVVIVSGIRVGFLPVVLVLLPHGIFELPGYLIASGYGLWLGIRFYRKLRYGEPFKEAFWLSMRKYVTVVLPLLFIAAFIEAYLSTWLSMGMR